MSISRRDALLGASAAVVTGAATAPLAIKAAGEPLVALEVELIEARAAGDKLYALSSAASAGESWRDRCMVIHNLFVQAHEAWAKLDKLESKKSR